MYSNIEQFHMSNVYHPNVKGAMHLLKLFKIFTASEIIITAYTYGYLRNTINMAQPSRAKTRGRPRKHQSGWEETIRRVCISKMAYTLWQELKSEKSLLNDDSVARFLLSFYKNQ